MEYKNVAFWCENIFGFYTLKPIVERYQKKNYKIFVYTRKHNIKIFINYINSSQNIEIIAIEDIDSIFLRVLNYIYKNFLTNPKFSQMYYRQRKNNRDNFYHKYLGKTFYVSDKKINNLYTKFFSLFKNRLKSNLLISISRVHSNHLVCSKSTKHVSIMESWDHPVKAPYFHRPDVLLTWNEDLKTDYQKYQDFTDIKMYKMKPLKFRYIEERSNKSPESLIKSLKNENYIDDLNLVKFANIILYIATTSSVNPSGHKGEMKLIEQLCMATQKLGKKLYIKPKPNGPQGDYDIFRKKYSNVIVGTYATNPNSIDMLDEEYHTFRYLLLYYADFIVNFGTTFVLEASLLDKPILQLNLSKKDYGEFGEYSENLHIKKYLLNEYSVKIKNENDLIDILQKTQEVFKLYSGKIKKWILDNETTKSAI